MERVASGEVALGASWKQPASLHVEHLLPSLDIAGIGEELILGRGERVVWRGRVGAEHALD